MGCGPLGNASTGRAADEYLALFGHLLGFLLTHGATQQVSTPQRITGQYLGNLHHLFLIQDDAVGFFQDGL